MELMGKRIPEHLSQNGSIGGKWKSLLKDAILNETRVVLLLNRLDRLLEQQKDAVS